MTIKDYFIVVIVLYKSKFVTQVIYFNNWHYLMILGGGEWHEQNRFN